MNDLAQRQIKILFILFAFVLVPGLLWQFWSNLKTFTLTLFHIPNPPSN